MVLSIATEADKQHTRPLLHATLMRDFAFNTDRFRCDAL